jgi:hypothetical protein
LRFSFGAEWHPPTEAELAILEAKRAYRDKVSGKLGQCMLAGNTLLATHCATCDVGAI